MQGDNKPAALKGYKVLDLSRMLPGAFCTQLLADMGADVIMIEQPGVGDYSRAFAPLHRKESGSFLLLHRNKRSMTLNLKAEAAKKILLEMVRTADILVESYRPGVMERLGLSYEVLSEINPGMVYCSISGYGQVGPYRLKPGHDLNYMAEAGTLQLFGRAGEGPIVPGLSIADVGGGSWPALAGILAALLYRAQSGKGQHIDISMQDGAIALLSLHAADYFCDKIEPKGGERPFIGQAPCYNVYRCADGKYIALGVIEGHFWEKFCDAAGLPDLKSNQWPVGDEALAQKKVLEGYFAMQSRDTWVEKFAPVDIPFGPVLGIEETFNDPHVKSREMLQSVDHPVEGAIPQLGHPIKLSATPCTIRIPPPTLGQHSEEILSSMGFSAGDIKALRESDAI